MIFLNSYKEKINFYNRKSLVIESCYYLCFFKGLSFSATLCSCLSTLFLMKLVLFVDLSLPLFVSTKLFGRNESIT